MSEHDSLSPPGRSRSVPTGDHYLMATVSTAAIANAVYHATGKRVRQLPIRIEDLLAV